MNLPVPRALVVALVLVLGGAVAVSAGNADHQPRTLAEMAGMAPTPSTAAGERGRALPREAETTTSEAPAPSTTTTGQRPRKKATARPAQVRGELQINTTTTQRPPTLEESVLRAAVERIDYPWQRTGFDIVLGPARSGYLAITQPTTRTIEVYVRQGQTADEVARTVAHEIGHAVDVAFRTPQDRISYRDLRGLSQTGMWGGCDGCSDYATPAGDFAETFAYWLLGPGDYRSQIAAAPDAAQLEELAPLFAARAL